jgi:hypothetical protein
MTLDLPMLTDLFIVGSGDLTVLELIDSTNSNLVKQHIHSVTVVGSYDWSKYSFHVTSIYVNCVAASH